MRVFDKYWFKKHQSKLLWLANSWLGPIVFRFHKMGHYLENKIIQIDPNGVHEFVSYKDGQLTAKFHAFCRNEYARKLYLVLLPMWWAMHVWDLLADPLLPQLSFGFSTLTVYPDSGSGGIDGAVLRGSVDETWGTITAGAGNDKRVTDNTGNYINISSNNTSDKYGALYRSIFTFDTSSLTSSATISAAVLSLFGTAKANGGSYSPNIDIYAATPASNNALVNGDYTQIGSTSQTGSSPITYANWSTSAYNDFTFNATGIGNISKTGFSKFGARNANYDVAASGPTWVSFAIATISGEWSRNGSNKPKLVVTYTLAAPAGGSFILNHLV